MLHVRPLLYAVARGSGRSSPFTFTVPIAKAEARASTLVGSAKLQAMGATLAAAEARASTLVGSAKLQAMGGHAGSALGRCARAVACCGGPIVADFMGILGPLAGELECG